MKPVDDLINRLKAIASELKQAKWEEEQRHEPPKLKYEFRELDLSGFDLGDHETRSQLLINPYCIGEPIPTSERFSWLVKDLVVDIKAARIYLQTDVYPKLKAKAERLARLEVALEQLVKLSEDAEVEEGYYLDDLFVRDEEGEFCWDCAVGVISETRIGLMFVCLLMMHKHPKLAYTLWEICDRANWWKLHYYRIVPYACDNMADGLKCCNRCATLLSYSLTGYGAVEEADHFLDYDGEMTSRQWYQLHAVFEAAQAYNWPNYLAGKLEILIYRYLRN